MEGIARIMSSASESWVAWAMLLLLLLPLLSSRLQPGLLVSAFSSLFSVKERESLFSQLSPDIRSTIFMLLYKVAILAMSLCVVCLPQQFSFKAFALTLALVVVVMVLKFLISRFLAYVFFDKNVFATCLNHYSMLLTAVLVAAYPFLLVALFVSVPYKLILICATIFVFFFYICVIIKLFRLFFTKLLVCFYILLYLCMLEWLPLGVLVVVTWQYISGIL